MAHQSILDYFLKHAEQASGRTAALVKRDGGYKPMTWGELASDVEKIAAGLVGLGINAGDRVCVISATRVEWVLCDMAILYAGAVTVPIYPSNLPEECQYICENSAAVVIFAEDDAQVQKFRSQRAGLPQVKKIIQLEGEVRESDGWVVSLEQLCKEAVINRAVLTARRTALTKNSVATLIYTSGTTGRPKGVMTTHDNLLCVAEGVVEIDIVRESDVQLIFLPLAHSFAKILCIAWLASRHVLAFAESMATLRENMAETRPTVLAGVPRVFEKFYGAVVQKGAETSGLTGKLFARAALLSDKRGEAQLRGGGLSRLDDLQYRLLKKLVFAKVNKGLSTTFGGRMRILVSGGAPLSAKISYFFRDAGFEILEGFGLTETTAATVVNRVGRNRIGTVGLPMPNMEVKLAEDGELLIRGRGVTSGYWQDPAATAEVLIDGWFTTGDVGQILPDGSIRIRDRKKDIIVTAGGKNVAPQNLENLLKSYKLISQAVVHGDRRNYLTAVITLDSEALKSFAQQHNLGHGSYAELTQKPEVFKAVQAALEDMNKQLPKYETIKKFKILEHDFSLESGELTPSLKVKRKLVNQRYKSTFDSFYDEAY